MSDLSDQAVEKKDQVTGQKGQAVIFCCHPSIYSSIVLAALLKNPQVSIAAVVLSTRIRYLNSNAFKDILSIIRDSGFRYAIYLGWISFVYNIVGGIFALAPVHRQCSQRGIAVLNTENINNAEGQDFIRQQSDALLVTVMFNQKLSSETLALKNLNCVNLHPGKLPEYRGFDPVLIALQHKQAVCEITLHKTEAEFDAGDIISSQGLAVDKNQSVFWHQYHLFKLGGKILSNYLSARSENPSDIAKPQQGEAAYYSWPNKSSMRDIDRLISLSDIKTLLFSR